jgi:hypothetical protein
LQLGAETSVHSSNRRLPTAGISSPWGLSSLRDFDVEIVKAAYDFQFFALCEVTGELQLGVANIEKSLLKVTRKQTTTSFWPAI